jgi:colanic acid/amylovoran biosynthesis glycosyltransferase
MRVLYLVSLFPCWSETFIVREINELLKLGVDVRIVSLKHPAEKMVQSDAQALSERVLYPPSNRACAAQVIRSVLRHPLRELKDLAMMVRGLGRKPAALAKTLVVWWRTLGLLPAIEAFAPDHLHAHWATYPSTAALLVSLRTARPFSFTAHAHDIFLEDHLLAEKLKRAAFGVTISQFNRRFIADKLRSAVEGRLHIVHCGVDPSAFRFRPQDRVPGELVAVGRLDEIKGFEYLIDACALLRDRGAAFTCRIIGDGPLRTALSERIHHARLAERVSLLGARPQEEVRGYLDHASVFVLPSVVTARGDRDGIPVALMEAMAVGLPVVSTRVSGIPELVEHGESGLLAEPRDALGLARCIEHLLADPSAARRMAARARATVERDFDVATETRKLRDAFA